MKTVNNHNFAVKYLNNENLLENINTELDKGLQLISSGDKLILFIGSARKKLNDKYYDMACDTAKLFGESGYNIITGGGPGIMEAASKGGYLADVETYGINIILPYEQVSNKYLTKEFMCKYFFARKLILYSKIDAVICFPGGFGTLDEFYEIITHVATDTINRIPIVLVYKDFWEKCFYNVADTLLENGMITEQERNIPTLVDTPKEALAVVLNCYNDI